MTETVGVRVGLQCNSCTGTASAQIPLRKRERVAQTRRGYDGSVPPWPQLTVVCRLPISASSSTEPGSVRVATRSGSAVAEGWACHGRPGPSGPVASLVFALRSCAITVTVPARAAAES
jgi:hypothetical protein